MFRAVMISMLMLMSVSAVAQTCPPLTVDYTCTTVTVFDQSFSMDHVESNIGLDPMGTKLGINSLLEEMYRTDDTDDWLDFTQLLESKTATVPGLIVEATLYTDIASPSHVLTVSDIEAVSFKIRRLGKFYHRLYEFDTTSSSFIETVSFRDELTGHGTAAWSQDMQWYAFGSQIPSYSSVFTFVLNDATAWSGFGADRDFDVQLHALSFQGSTTHGMTDIPTVLGGDPTDGPGGVMDSSCKTSGIDNCQSDMWPACRDMGDPIDPNRKGCGKKEGICSAKALSVDSGLSISSADLITMYALRNRMKDVPAVQSHVTGYYAVGSVIDWSDTTEVASVLAAYNPTMAGADKIVNGSGSDIIVTPALRIQLSTLLTGLTGRNLNVDGYIQALQADLVTSQGMSRTQFCSHFTGVNDCGF